MIAFTSRAETNSFDMLFRPCLHLVVEQADGALERVFEAEPLAQHPLGLPEAVDAPRTLHLVARVKARLHQEHARRRSQRDAAVTHLKEARAKECVKSGGAIIHSDACTGNGLMHVHVLSTPRII